MFNKSFQEIPQTCIRTVRTWYHQTFAGSSRGNIMQLSVRRNHVQNWQTELQLNFSDEKPRLSSQVPSFGVLRWMGQWIWVFWISAEFLDVFFCKKQFLETDMRLGLPQISITWNYKSWSFLGSAWSISPVHKLWTWSICCGSKLVASKIGFTQDWHMIHTKQQFWSKGLLLLT